MATVPGKKRAGPRHASGSFKVIGRHGALRQQKLSKAKIAALYLGKNFPTKLHAERAIRRAGAHSVDLFVRRAPNGYIILLKPSAKDWPTREEARERLGTRPGRGKSTTYGDPPPRDPQKKRR